LEHVQSKQEIIFIAEADSTLNYKFELDLSAKSKLFGGISGTYLVELLIGDPVISNSIQWPLGELNLKFAEDEKPAPKQKDVMYKTKPAISHTFREADKRPPSLVSNAFTALVISPLVILLILWIKLGANISNFPFSFTSIGFHLGLAGTFGLFGVFWWKLNMFQTLKCLAGIGTITFLFGNKLLASLASKRKQEK